MNKRNPFRSRLRKIIKKNSSFRRKLSKLGLNVWKVNIQRAEKLLCVTLLDRKKPKR